MGYLLDMELFLIKKIKGYIGRILRCIDNKHVKKIDKYLKKYTDDESWDYLIKKMAYDLPLDTYNSIVKKSIQYALSKDEELEYYEMSYKYLNIIKYKILEVIKHII